MISVQTNNHESNTQVPSSPGEPGWGGDEAITPTAAEQRGTHMGPERKQVRITPPCTVILSLGPQRSSVPGEQSGSYARGGGKHANGSRSYVTDNTRDLYLRPRQEPGL